MNSFNCFTLWGLKEIDHPKENHPSFEIGRGKEACLLHELEVVFSLSATILLFTKEGGFGWKQTWLHSKCQRKHEEVKTHLFLSMCMCVCVCVCMCVCTSFVEQEVLVDGEGGLDWTILKDLSHDLLRVRGHTVGVLAWERRREEREEEREVEGEGKWKKR